jgi:hypothetical protein
MFFAVGCTAPIDISVRDAEARPVIYCTLTDRLEPQRVEVGRTAPYFSVVAEAWVDDAAVTISSSGGDLFDAVWDGERKAYLTEPFAVEPDVDYTLSVTFDFDGDGLMETYTATTRAKEPPVAGSLTYGPDQVLESIAIEPYDMPMSDIPLYVLKLSGHDPPGRDFYVFRIEIDGELRRGIAEWMTVGDLMFQDGAIDDFPLGLFAAQPDEQDPDAMWFPPGARVRLLVSDVEMDFMRFVSEVQGSGGGANPMFGGPPYNMRTNISDGALGWFGSLWSLPLEATVPGTPNPNP